MNTQTFQISCLVYDSLSELNEKDQWLVLEARKTTAAAYAPYSHFLVGAVARMHNGQVVYGTNQENASYPVGICAERTLLASAATQFPDESIDTMAISYHNLHGKSNNPISPCGMCRQSLVEFEERVQAPVRLILSGMEGKLIVFEKAAMLLPMSFGSLDLKPASDSTQ
jgi:cytidine deaminase